LQVDRAHAINTALKIRKKHSHKRENEMKRIISLVMLIAALTATMPAQAQKNPDNKAATAQAAGGKTAAPDGKAVAPGGKQAPGNRPAPQAGAPDGKGPGGHEAGGPGMPPEFMGDEAPGDSAALLGDALDDEEIEEATGPHKILKKKFIEGNAGFMSLVAIALILGLAFCIERIIYLSLSEINAKKLLADIEKKVEEDDMEGAKDICRNTRGPVASLCYQGILRIKDSIDDIERSVENYAAVQVSNLEKGTSWIKLFIAIAPSLGFLGTVVGMVMAFEDIQQAGDISASIVAAGMKVALITTIFGIVVAVILQIFYNYILSKIEHLEAQMEESVVSLIDIIQNYKKK